MIRTTPENSIEGTTRKLEIHPHPDMQSEDSSASDSDSMRHGGIATSEPESAGNNTPGQSDCAHVPIQPAALFVLTFACGFGLGKLASLEFLSGSLIRNTGYVAVASGMMLSAWAILCMKAAGTTVKPGAPVTAFVCQGPYRISRNPMYLALLAIHLGLGLILGNWGVLLTTGILGALLDRLSIRPEEHLLSQRFGIQYSAYCGKVRRWI